MQFVQLIEFQTACIDDVMAVLRRVHHDAVADRPELKAEIRKDRDRHDRYVLVLSSPVPPEAVEANAAAVERLTTQLGPYIDGQVVIRNLDLIDGDSYAFGERVAVRASRVR